MTDNERKSQAEVQDKYRQLLILIMIRTSGITPVRIIATET